MTSPLLRKRHIPTIASSITIYMYVVKWVQQTHEVELAIIEDKVEWTWEGGREGGKGEDHGRVSRREWRDVVANRNRETQFQDLEIRLQQVLHKVHKLTEQSHQQLEPHIEEHEPGRNIPEEQQEVAQENAGKS